MADFLLATGATALLSLWLFMGRRGRPTKMTCGLCCQPISHAQPWGFGEGTRPVHSKCFFDTRPSSRGSVDV